MLALEGGNLMTTVSRGILAGLLLFSFACATPTAVYRKAGGSEAERKRDTAECVEAAIGHEPGRHIVTPVVIDRESFARCLESRGYARVP
jgi:hypothetical protein